MVVEVAAEEAAVAEVNWFEHQVRVRYKIACNVTFTRSTPVTGAGYRPHLVAETDPEYKGVTFLDPLVIGENKYIRFEPLYPDRINYQPLLKRGTKFEIKEGPNTVGTGVITMIRDRFCSQ